MKFKNLCRNYSANIVRNVACSLQTVGKYPAYSLQILCNQFIGTVLQTFSNHSETVANYLQSICKLFAEYMHAVCRAFANCLQMLCKLHADTQQRVCKIYALLLSKWFANTLQIVGNCFINYLCTMDTFLVFKFQLYQIK